MTIVCRWVLLYLPLARIHDRRVACYLCTGAVRSCVSLDWMVRLLHESVSCGAAVLLLDACRGPRVPSHRNVGAADVVSVRQGLAPLLSPSADDPTRYVGVSTV